MKDFLQRFKKGAQSQMPDAPDGSADTIRSGRWSTQLLIDPQTFPQTLLLTQQDRGLHRKLGTQLVLQSMQVGKHRVELILTAGTENTVDLSMRVPTASNQFRDPYILLEAEPGNTCEDAVREIGFHLQGRVPDTDVLKADWPTFFQSAAKKLATLRS